MICKHAASVLRGLRCKSGFTRSQLANISNFTVDDIADFEEEKREITIEDAKSLSKHLRDYTDLFLWVLNEQN